MKLSSILMLSFAAYSFAACSFTESLGESELGDDEPHDPVLGQPRWTLTLGGPNYDEPFDIAFDSAGDVVIAGAYGFGADMGNGMLPNGQGQAGFVMKRAATDGALRWLSPIAASSFARVSALAITDDDGVVVAGHYMGTADFAGTTLAGSGPTAFIARYEPDGDLAWVRSLDVGEVYLRSIAIDSLGAFYGAGVFPGSVDVGSGPIAGGGGLIMRFSPIGEVEWARAFPGIELLDVVEMADSDVVVTGSLTGSVSIGGGALPSRGEYDHVVARYTSSGDHVWSRNFGPLAGFAMGFAVTLVGDQLVFAVHEEDPAQVGESARTQWWTVRSLDQSGNELWTRRPESRGKRIQSIASGPDGTILVGGHNSQSSGSDFGTGPVPEGSCLVAYDADGTPADARSVGGNGFGADVIWQIAVAPSGVVAYTVGSVGTIDLGLGPNQGYGGKDISIVVLDPLAP